MNPDDYRNDPSRRVDVGMDWGQIQDVLGVAMRALGGCLAAILLLAGLSLAFNAFNLVRDLVTTPAVMTEYLDGWDRTLSGPVAAGVEVTAPAGAAAPAPETAPAGGPQSTPGKAPEGAAPGKAPEAEASPAAAPEEAPKAVPEEAPKAAPRAGVAKTAMRKGKSEPTALEIVNKLADAVVEGRMARPVGAVFILLLTAILVRIPFGVMAAGTRLLGAAFAAKKDGFGA